MTTTELNHLLTNFLDRWDIEKVREMSLEEYVGVGNKDTFCQWVETKTKPLGSMKGFTSIKFGIYKREDPNKKPKNYQNDKEYSWLQGYGETRDVAFENVKSDIIRIIGFSEKGHFNKIDDLILPDLFKWKVAFLYSNERLVPIYKREVLLKIADHFGLNTHSQTKVSEIQKIMINSKPINQDVYSYMLKLLDQFKSDSNYESNEGHSVDKGQNRTRKGTTKRDTRTQLRTITHSYIAEQKHNKIQKALRKKLCEKYGEENVILEENHVDVKLFQPNYVGFYEVKSSSYASDCVKEALGQVLLYTHRDQDPRSKKIFIVGQYPPNSEDLRYLSFIKKQLSIEFEYLSIGIE